MQRDNPSDGEVIAPLPREILGAGRSYSTGLVVPGRALLLYRVTAG